MRFEGFCGGTDLSSATRANAEWSVNLYPETLGAQAKGRPVLRGTPGLDEFCTLATSPVRALWSNDPSGVISAGRLFAAAGTALYEVTSAGVPTSLGTIANDADNSPVQVFPNGTQLFVIASGKGYLHNGTTLAECSFTDGGGTVNFRTGAFIDSYFVGVPAGKKIYLSALLDGTTWDPLDYFTKEGYPDNIIGILTYQSEIWCFGDQSIEAFRNEGDADTPFRRDPSAFIATGAIAPWSIINFAGPAWLGGDERGRPVAYRMQGFTPVPVSTPAMEQLWSAYTRTSDAISYTYAENGHHFWVLRFPTAGHTWCYDLASGMWHERAAWNGSVYSAHLSRCHCHVFGKHLVGSATTGKIYQQSETLLDDDGTAIRRLRQAPHISAGEANVVHHALRMDLDLATDNTTSEYYLSWSNDGGKTYSTALLGTPARDAEDNPYVEWRRLGKARDRIYRVTSTASIAHCWVGADLRLTAGV